MGRKTSTVERIIPEAPEPGAPIIGDTFDVHNAITAPECISSINRNKVTGYTEVKTAKSKKPSAEFDFTLPIIKEALEIQEAEMSGISEELHDTVAQWLTSVSYYSQLARGLISISQSAEATEEINRIQVIVNQSIREIRQVMVNLNPQLLNKLGLVSALQSYVILWEPGKSFKCSLIISGKPSRLPWTHEITVYRVIMEALNNVKKHAGASDVEINLQFYPNNIRAIVADDGRGFNPAGIKNNDGEAGIKGLLVMYERAKLVGGDLKVESAPGQGTRIILEIPTARRRNVRSGTKPTA